MISTAVRGVRHRWRRLPRLPRAVAIAAVAVLTAVVATGQLVTERMHSDAAPFTYDDVAGVPARTVAVVFGAFVAPDGVPSGALADRLRAGVDLYRAGRVRHLLMTGDNSTAAYDEVTAMRAFAIAAGVPPDAITRDYAGLDTYDSCLRASTVFGVRDAVLVTQSYHLPRALYLCRHQGIDAVGLSVPDWQHHPERLDHEYTLGQRLGYSAREWLARANASVDAQVRRRGAAVPGPFEGLRPT